MNGSQKILSLLLDQGVRTVFGYPGGAIMPLYDVLPQFPLIKHILVRHEQAAVFAAQGRARTTGEVGVAFATSGPGFANTMTALADAMMDSIPIVLITGQVFSSLIGKDAFQEMDTIGASMSITKHNFLVRNRNDLESIIIKAFDIARSGRPGPVHIDIPKDIFLAEGGTENTHIHTMIQQGITRLTPSPPSDLDIGQIYSFLAEAKKPIILVGQGIKHAQARKDMRQLIEKLSIPVVTTLLAKGIIPDTHPLNLGCVGMHGWYHANMALYYSDCIINIGSRFDDRIVGTYTTFAQYAKVIHIDIDRSELGKVVATDLAIHSCAKQAIHAMLHYPNQKIHHLTDWWGDIQQWKSVSASHQYGTGFGIPQVYNIINAYMHNKLESHYIATDVGQHQMRAWQILHIASPYHRMSSGGAGSMGFGIPTGMGASFAHPNDIITVCVGDGGFQMSFNELQTIKDHQCNIKIIVLDNGFLGMVRQRQELFFDKNYSQTPITSPSFTDLARSFGIASWYADTPSSCTHAIQEAYSMIGPALIHCRVQGEDNVFPMVPAGKSLKETQIQ